MFSVVNSCGPVVVLGHVLLALGSVLPSGSVLAWVCSDFWICSDLDLFRLGTVLTHGSLMDYGTVAVVWSVLHTPYTCTLSTLLIQYL